MPQKLPLKTFRSIYSQVPRLCVDLVVLNNQHEVLLTFRSIPPKNLWHLPGGTVLFGETPTATIQRVALEELGQKVIIQNSWASLTIIPATIKKSPASAIPFHLLTKLN